jgi:hypothetical protein
MAKQGSLYSFTSPYLSSATCLPLSPLMTASKKPASTPPYVHDMPRTIEDFHKVRAYFSGRSKAAWIKAGKKILLTSIKEFDANAH